MRIRLLILLFFSTVQSSEEIARFTYQTTDKLAKYISSSNFIQSGDTSLLRTYSITTPGTYILTENIASNIQTGASCVIYIDSDDVLLDLGGHIISLASAATGITGIAVNHSKNNITIQNGTITGFSIGLLIQTSSSNITIQDITITDSIIAGISCSASSGSESSTITLTRCSLNNNAGDASNDAIGLKINYCFSVEATDCRFNNNRNTNSSRDGYGVYATNSDGCILNNCYANNNKGELIGAGYHIESCKSWELINCSANNNSATNSSSSEAYGFNIQSTLYCKFYKCSANGTRCPFIAAGFNFNAARTHFLDSCSAIGTLTTANSASSRSIGFYVGNNGNSGLYFESCVALGMLATGNTSAKGIGFLVDKALYCTFYLCIASGVGNFGANYSSGLQIIDNNSVFTVVDGCRVYGIGSASPGGGSNATNNGGLYSTIGTVAGGGYGDYNAPAGHTVPTL